MKTKLKPPNHDDSLIERVSRIIPFGYRQHPDFPKWLVPIPHELEALDQAIQYLKTCSTRECAAWLEKKTGRKLSNAGLVAIARLRSTRYSTKTDPDALPRNYRPTETEGKVRLSNPKSDATQDNTGASQDQSAT